MGVSRRNLLLGGVLGGVTAGAGNHIIGKMVSASERRLVTTRVAEIPECPAGSSLDFLATGDTGQLTEHRTQVVDAMLRSARRVGAKFVTLAGDNIYPDGAVSAQDPAWKVHFEEPFKELIEELPFYPCLGNHDYSGDPAAQVDYSSIQERWVFPSNYHAFQRRVAADCGASFFVLDTTQLRLGSWSEYRHQMAWIERSLATSQAQWKVALGHHPMYSGGPKGGSSKICWRLGQTFAENSVDLFISGHNHDLELIDSNRGWLQIVTGAGSGREPEVANLPDTLFSSNRGGFVWVSLRREAAWLQFETLDGERTSFCVERDPISV